MIERKNILIEKRKENAGTDTFQLTTYSALITMALCQTLKGFNHDSTKEVAHFAC